MLPGIAFASDPYGCAEGANALVIVSEWDAFRVLDLGRLESLLRAAVLVDLRNIYPPEEATRRGSVHVGVGRPN